MTISRSCRAVLVACALPLWGGAACGEKGASHEQTAATRAAPATAKDVAPAPVSEAVTDVARMEVYDLAGLKADITRSGARVTIVPLWATWCAPCLEEMPHLAAFYDKHKAAGLRIVGLATDDREEMGEQLQRVLDRTKVPYKQALLTPGGERALFEGVGQTWDGQLPKTLVFDGRGEMVKLFPSAIDERVLEAEVAPLLDAR